jgi:phosphoglycerate dehydrogenase-like enzyme
VPEVERVYRRAAVRELLRASDYVVLAVPLTPETRGMVGEAELRAMRPGAWLVNIGRGALVQQDALARALRERWIAGAVLDVFTTEPLPATHPFWGTEGIMVLPHIGGLHPGRDHIVAELFTDNLQRFLAGQPLRETVDRARGY